MTTDKQTRAALVVPVEELEKLVRLTTFNTSALAAHVSAWAADILATPPSTPSPTVAGLTEDARECLQDVVSHHNSLRMACQTRWAKFTKEGDKASADYWTHEMGVLDRMKVQAESALAAPSDSAETRGPAGVIAWYRDETIDTREDSQGLPPNYVPFRRIHGYPERPYGEGWKPLFDSAQEHQEPVAEIESWTNGSYSRNYKVHWLRDVDAGTKLYTAPAATRAQGAVTDEDDEWEKLTQQVECRIGMDRQAWDCVSAIEIVQAVAAILSAPAQDSDARDAARYRLARTLPLVLMADRITPRRPDKFDDMIDAEITKRAAMSREQQENGGERG